MFVTRLKKAFATLVLAALPVGASASSIDLDALNLRMGDPVGTVADMTVDIPIDGDLFALSLLTGSSLSRFAPTGAPIPYSFFFASGGDTLNGDTAIAVSEMDGVIDLVFDDVTGDAGFADLSGGAVLVRLIAPDLDFDEATGLFTPGQITGASLSVTALTAIPLPAGLVLMLAGLGAFAGLRHRQGTSCA
jgi:hypothetical protein